MAEPGYPTPRQARDERKRRLAHLAAITEACKCLWPLVTMRNLHGHAPECPAVQVWNDQARAVAVRRRRSR